MSGPPQVLTIWGTVGFKWITPTGPQPHRHPAAPQAARGAHRSEVHAQPRRLPKMVTCPPPHCAAHAGRPRLPAPPRHQVQRPEEEVHELRGAGVLDVLLQLGLRGRGGSEPVAADRPAAGTDLYPQGQHRGRGRGLLDSQAN